MTFVQKICTYNVDEIDTWLYSEEKVEKYSFKPEQNEHFAQWITIKQYLTFFVDLL